MKNMFRALGKILLVGLVISLWAISSPAYAASANDYYGNDRGSLQTTERYDKIQSEVGGINNYNDTDPRRNTKTAEAKAKALKDTAERRKAQSSDPLEPAREAVDKLGDNVSESASDMADSLSDRLSR